MKTYLYRKIMAVLIIGLFMMQLIPAKPVLAAVDQTVYYNDMGKKIEVMANKYNIPPVLLKAIVWMESGWKQYKLDPITGQPLIDQPLMGNDGIGIGIMQISSYDPNDKVTMDRLKNDLDYNLEMGCQMLNQKWRATPKIGNGDRNVLENWYFAVWGYNCWGARNNPNSLTGKSAYQDSVFSLMGQKYNSAITFAPGATKISPSLLPSVDPPSVQSRWNTPTSTHLGDLVVNPNLLISSGGGSGADAANGDYWYNYARWSSYYALGFYITAYNSPLVTDKTVVSQKILSSYGNLLAEADALLLEGRDSSDASAAKYYWTIQQGPSLDAGITERARIGVQSALTKLLAEADKSVLIGTDASNASAASDYLIVMQGPSVDATLTERATIGYQKTYKPVLIPIPVPTPTPTPVPTPVPTPTPIPTPQPVVPSVIRLSGTRAEDTAIEISQAGWVNNSSPDVLLARVDRFQDALAAAPLAKKLKAPLLLTSSGKLDDAVLQEMKRLGSGGKVYVIGGTGAIKSTVTDALTAANLSFERIYGNTAPDTAAAIATQFGTSTQVILASSTSFPDALAASAPAAALGIPILLTEQRTLPESTKKILKDFQVTKTIIVGGKYAISTAFDSPGGALASYGPLRLAGDTKYDTMLQIVKYFGQDPKSIVIATGENFPDGLSGGAFAALTGSPMLLIPKVGLNADTKTYLNGLSGKTTKTYILGGTGAICTDSEKLISSLLTQ